MLHIRGNAKSYREKSFVSDDNSVTLSRPAEWATFIERSTLGNSIPQDKIIECTFTQISPKTHEAKIYLRNKISCDWYKFVKNNELSISKKQLLRSGIIEFLIKLVAKYNSKQRSYSKKLEQQSSAFRSCIMMEAPNLGKAFEEDNEYPNKSFPRSHSYKPPPILSENPEKWFEYFADPRCGALSQKDILYALYTSFNATSKERKIAIKNLIKAYWSRWGINDSACISKTRFLEDEANLSEALIDLELDLNIIAVDRPQDNTGEAVSVKVNIPNGMNPFSLIQVVSPRTNDLVILSIPAKKNWGGNGSSIDPFYFTVKF